MAPKNFGGYFDMTSQRLTRKNDDDAEDDDADDDCDADADDNENEEENDDDDDDAVPRRSGRWTERRC